MQWTRMVTDRARCCVRATLPSAVVRLCFFLCFFLCFCTVANRADAQAATPPQIASSAAPAESGQSDAAIPTKSLLGVLREGGLLMIPIGICSFILLVFVFERAVSLRQRTSDPATVRAAISRTVA